MKYNGALKMREFELKCIINNIQMELDFHDLTKETYEDNVRQIKEAKKELNAIDKINEKNVLKPKNELVEKYVPKKYRNAITDFYKDMDGYWIDLKSDYESSSTLCQTIHEYTIADIKKELKTIQKIK